MPALSLVKASNDAWCPPYVPVVVVYGGTSGIAKAMTKRLAEQLQGRIHIIVVGRRKAIADALFASLPRPRPEYAEGCAYEFVFCDLRIMNSVHQATEEISNRCGKINYLILASGEAFFGRRRETEDGIESQLVLRYYYKFSVINDLLPKLRAAKDLKEAAGVFTILGHGLGPKIDFTNLNSTEGHLLGVGPMIYGLTYGDLMLSMYAEREPEIAFTHMYPGMVATEALTPPMFDNYIFKLLMVLIIPLRWLFFINVAVSAENMVYGMLAGEKGFYQRGVHADTVGPRNVTYPDEDKKKFWEYSLKMTKSVPR